MSTPPGFVPVPVMWVLILVFFTLGAGGALLLRWGWIKLTQFTRPGVLWLNPETNQYRYERVQRVAGGDDVEVGKGDKRLRHTLRGEARLMGNLGALWLLHPIEGHNFIAPTSTEVRKDRGMAWLGIFNPLGYAHAMARNETQDTLLANNDKESPWAKAMPWMFAGLLVVIVGLIFLVWKLAPTPAPAPVRPAAAAFLALLAVPAGRMTWWTRADAACKAAWERARPYMAIWGAVHACVLLLAYGAGARAPLSAVVWTSVSAAAATLAVVAWTTHPRAPRLEDPEQRARIRAALTPPRPGEGQDVG